MNEASRKNMMSISGMISSRVRLRGIGDRIFMALHLSIKRSCSCSSSSSIFAPQRVQKRESRTRTSTIGRASLRSSLIGRLVFLAADGKRHLLHTRSARGFEHVGHGAVKRIAVAADIDREVRVETETIAQHRAQLRKRHLLFLHQTPPDLSTAMLTMPGRKSC